MPLTEMSTRTLPGGKGRPARGADNLTAIFEPIVYKNVGASTSHNPMVIPSTVTDMVQLHSFCEVSSCTLAVKTTVSIADIQNDLRS
jgi:hypothetical protein